MESTYSHRLQDDDILRSREIKFPYCRKFAENASPEDLIVQDILLECEAEKEPLHPTKGEPQSCHYIPTILLDLICHNLGVTVQNCTLTADLNQVPKELFKKKKSKTGENYTELHYKLMVSVAAKMTFSLQVAGKVIGRVLADY